MLVLFCAAGAMSAFGCGCTRQGGGDTTSARVDPEQMAESSVAPKTVLRIECDIPDDVGSVARTYPGRIDWAGGSETFSFRLSKETLTVPLENVVRIDQTVRVFFIVEEDPPFPTKFGREEWFYRGRLRRDVNASHANTFCVRLSRFRGAHHFATRLAP